MEVLPAAQIESVCFHVRRGCHLLDRTFLIVAQHDAKRRHDALGNLILYLENVLELAIVAVGP